jgi:aconitate decarboxylase
VHTAWPYKPAGVTAAQMNLFYGLAMIALHRDASVRQYDAQGLADPAALAFMERISAFEDEGLEAMGAAFRHAARVTVTTRDRRIFCHERLARRGSPEDAVGSAEIERKFASNVSQVLTPSDAERLRALVMGLETLDSVSDVTMLLGSAVS